MMLVMLVVLVVISKVDWENCIQSQEHREGQLVIYIGRLTVEVSVCVANCATFSDRGSEQNITDEQVWKSVAKGNAGLT